MLSYFVALAKTSPWTLYRHMLLHMYLYTHVYVHTALSVREVRPKAGWLLQILLVYSGFLPFSCQSLLFIQSSRCLLRVYSCFFRVLQHVDTVFKLGVLLFFMYLCVEQDLNKRLSLPADIRIPDGYLEKLQLSSPPFDQPLSRRSRRASLVRCTHSCADTTLKKNLKTWLPWKVVVLRNLADLWMFKCNGKYKSNWTTSVCGPVTNQLPVIHLSLSPHAISSLHSCLFVVMSVGIEHNGLIHQKLLNGQLSV